MNGMLNLAQLMSDERERLRRGWGGFVAVGVLLAVLGFVGLIFVGVTTMLSVLFVGWAFLISGAAEVIHAIVRKGWSGFWLDVLSGLITGLAGLFIVLHPLAGASVLTIVLGVMFLVGGVFRIAAGIALRCPYSGWFVLHGLVSLLLGGMIIAEWPNSLVWVIGTLVAIDLLVDGLRLISFGLALRRLPDPATDEYRAPTAPAAG